MKEKEGEAEGARREKVSVELTRIAALVRERL